MAEIMASVVAKPGEGFTMLKVLVPAFQRTVYVKPDTIWPMYEVTGYAPRALMLRVAAAVFVKFA